MRVAYRLCKFSCDSDGIEWLFLGLFYKYLTCLRSGPPDLNDITILALDVMSTYLAQLADAAMDEFGEGFAF